MITRDQILATAAKDPQYAAGIHAIKQKLGDMPITPQALAELIKMFEFAINHPAQYQKIRAAAIKDGMVDAEDMPERPDPKFLISILVALYGLQATGKARGFARGGLATAAAQLRSKGRNGDTILAHITPEEAIMLQKAGGSGRLNPDTGLPEFGFLSDLLKIVVPLAINFFAPGVGTALGAAVGASAAWAPIVGSAIIGGVTSGLTGGNVLQGAALGGVGAGLGSVVGSGVDSVLGTGMSEGAKNVIGGALTGGAMGAATGKGLGEGALMGAASAGLGSMLKDQQGLNSLGEKYGPDTPDEGLSALGQKYGPEPEDIMNQSPSEQVISNLKSGDDTQLTLPGANIVPDQQPSLVQPVQQVDLTQAQQAQPGSGPESDMNYRNQQDIASDAYKPNAVQAPAAATPVAKAAAAAPQSKGFSLTDAAKYMTVAQGLGSLLQAPAQVQSAVATLPPNVQAMFNEPAKVWDWTKMQNDASKAGVSLPQFMASNWNVINNYAAPANSPTAGIAPIAPPKQFAGGGLNQVAMALAQGGGTGRSDSIDAKLSDGEYVMDAETVALLGDGSTKAGAARLDQMRAAIRQHKGRALAHGQISPGARPPMAYLQGAR